MSLAIESLGACLAGASPALVGGTWTAVAMGADVRPSPIKIPCGLRAPQHANRRDSLDARRGNAHFGAMIEKSPEIFTRERAQSIPPTGQAYTAALALVAVSTLLGLWIAPR